MPTRSTPAARAPSRRLTLEEAQDPLEDASPELTAIRDEANEILDGGADDFDARLAELEAAGIPVVINKWASWCGPCRDEFPDFQTQAIEHGDDVAFIGLLSNDGPETGAHLPLKRFPCRIRATSIRTRKSRSTGTSSARSQPLSSSTLTGRSHTRSSAPTPPRTSSLPTSANTLSSYGSGPKDNLEPRSLAPGDQCDHHLRRRSSVPVGMGRLAAPGGTAPSFGGLGVALFGIIFSYALMAYLLAWLKAVVTHDEGKPVRHDWNRSLSAERRTGPQTHPIEDIVISATILVGIVCTLWFLLFGDPGVRQAP